MLVSVYEADWFRAAGAGIRAAIDPTRMAQGIMTGIGFLGAGVIMRDGLTVRGLTTAASIWITAGIGILVGIGFYFPAVLTTVLSLGALAGFRWIERHIRTESYAELVIAFAADRAPRRPTWSRSPSSTASPCSGITHCFRRRDAVMEYGMTCTASIARRSRACRTRCGRGADVVEFRISPTGD